METDRRTELLTFLRQYREQGLQPIPLLPRAKNPVAKDWTHRSFNDEAFSANANLGVKTGLLAKGGYVTDVDYDDPATAALAPPIVPDTGDFGRLGRPVSHSIYLTDEPIIKKVYENGPKKFFELRGLNAPEDGAAASPYQTMFPPSVHPTGEVLRWNSRLEFAYITAAELRRLAGWLATVRLFQDYWLPTNRHELALALAGWLAISGWQQEEVVKLVRLISEAAGDRETRDRETAIAGTFAKLRGNNRKFRQKNRFIELLGEAGKHIAGLIEDWLALQPLPVNVAGMTLTQAVEALRHESGRVGDRNRRIAEVVARGLSAKEQGFLGHGEDDLLYYFSQPENRLFDLADPGFQYYLAFTTGLNPAEAEFRFVLADLRVRASRLPPKPLGILGSYDPATRHLEVSNGSARLWVHDPGGQWQARANGDGCTLFATTGIAEPWAPEFEGSKGALDKFVKQILFEETGSLSIADQRWLVRMFLLWLFFPKHHHDKPILNLIGEYGSGKSMAERLIGMLLIGLRFENSTLQGDRKDFEAMLCGRSLAVVDNIDEPSTYLEGSLATYATGGDIDRRSYYTTNSVASFKPRAFLLVNSIDPKFRRQDIADRMFPLHVKRPTGGFKSPAKLRDALALSRGKILGDLLNELARVADQAFSAGPAPDLPLRLADFAEFGWVVARLDGRQGDWEKLLVRLTGAQAGFATENDSRFETLIEWAEQCIDTAKGSVKVVAPRDLFDECVGMAKHFGYNWFSNAQGMSQFFRNSRPMIERTLKCKVEFSRAGHGNQRTITFTRLEGKAEQDAEATEDAPAAEPVAEQYW